MLLYYMHKSCKISIKNFEIIVNLKNSITADLIWSSLPIFSEIKTLSSKWVLNALVSSFRKTSLDV